VTDGIEETRFEVGFQNLCQLIASYLEDGRESRALALAMAFLVFDDEAAYSNRSSAHESGPSVDQALQAVSQAESDTGRKAAIDSEWLLAGFEASPFSLLTWLDHRLATGEGTTSMIPASLSARDVETIVFTKPELDAVGVNATMRTVYVFPKPAVRFRAPAQAQTHDMGRFLVFWEVLPHIVDANKRSRTVAAHSASSDFRDGFRGPLRGRTLRVYLAEFLLVPEFDSRWHQGPKWRIWTANGLVNDGAINDIAREHLRRAASLKADVVIFPELTITSTTLSAIQQGLQSLAVGAPDSAPCMVVAGSFHIVDGRMIRNRSVVLDGAGKSVWTHDKLTQVELTGPMIQEGNTPGDLLTLIPTPIGTHAIAICLDLAQAATSNETALKRVPVRWLWVPSMSASVSAHLAQSRTLCVQRLITICCANQSQADFGEGVALGNGAGLSFAWINEGNSSAAAKPLTGDSGEASGGKWHLFDLPLEPAAP